MISYCGLHSHLKGSTVEGHCSQVPLYCGLSLSFICLSYHCGPTLLRISFLFVFYNPDGGLVVHLRLP
jgi:hypothetical protein